MAETVQQLLRERASDDTPGVRYGDRTWTWREHIAEASAEAAALIGLADPDRPLHVGVLLGNTPDMLRAMAAAGLGGYVLCGINTTRRGEGLAADVRRAECQLLVTDAEHRHLLDGLDLPGVRVLDTSTSEWSDLLARCAEELVPHREVEAMDTFMMIFTSGTSGDPKAVQVAHLMVLFSGLNLVGRFDITPEDVCYLSMPLFHSNAVVAGWAVALAGGAAMAPAKFSASRFLEDVRAYGATYMNYVGRPLAYVLATPEQPDDADNPLRVAFGNEAGDRDIDEFSRRFGCTVMDGFGSTELAVIITREEGTPTGLDRQGLRGRRHLRLGDGDRVRRRGVRRARCAGERRRGGRGAGRTRRAPATSRATTTTSRRTASGCATGCTGRATSPTATPTAGSTSPVARPTGCASTARTSPRRRSSGSSPGWRRSTGSRCTPCPDAHVGDQVMAAVVLQDDATLTPEELEAFLAEQPDLSPEGVAALRPGRGRPAEHRHQQGAQARAGGPGCERRRGRAALGARGARDGVRRGGQRAGVSLRVRNATWWATAASNQGLPGQTSKWSHG